MLNQKILQRYIVTAIFLNFIKSWANFAVLQITFQGIIIKKLDFNIKRFQRNQNYNFHFLLHILWLISIITGKLSQHIALSYILFKKSWKEFKTKIN